MVVGGNFVGGSFVGGGSHKLCDILISNSCSRTSSGRIRFLCMSFSSSISFDILLMLQRGTILFFACFIRLTPLWCDATGGMDVIRRVRKAGQLTKLLTLGQHDIVNLFA